MGKEKAVSNGEILKAISANTDSLNTLVQFMANGQQAQQASVSNPTATTAPVKKSVEEQLIEAGVKGEISTVTVTGYKIDRADWNTVMKGYNFKTEAVILGISPKA